MNAMAGFRDDDNVTQLRVPPHSIESEQAVLGGLMLAPESLPEVADLLEADDFYRRDHQLIYRAIREQADKGKPFDTVILGDWFTEQGQLELIAGGAYLIELASTTPSAANIRAYAEQVRDRSLMRKLIETGTEIVNDAFDAPADSAEQAVATAAAKLAGMTVKASGTGGLTMLRGGLQSAWDELEQRYHGEADLGLQMPWPNVVRKLPGLEPGDLMILAARPAMGKTACAVQIALHAAEHHNNVAFFSLEMSKKQLSLRLMALKAMVDMSRMREKQGLTDDDWAALSDARHLLDLVPLAIDDEASLTVDGLAARATRMHTKVQGGLGLIVVDYLQLLAGGGKKTDNRTEEVGYISRSLKKLAKKLHCPIIALSQLNRSVEQRTDKRPVMADLRESGAIEQDADIIAFLFRDDYYTKDLAGAPGVSEFIIGKQRQGPTGTAYLRHRLECSAFENYHGSRPDYTPKKTIDGPAGESDGFDDPAPRRPSRRSGKDAAGGGS